MKYRYPVALALASAAAPGMAANLAVKVELPQLNVAEYHRPYLAMWLETADQQFAGNLSVWYDLKKKDNAGTKWLTDMRQWWRKSGRELIMPVDGVSSATRAPGEHTLVFTDNKSVLGKLAPGAYQVVVEVAREAGGRELVRVPLQWPPKGEKQTSAQGKGELGKITVTAK